MIYTLIIALFSCSIGTSAEVDPVEWTAEAVRQDDGDILLSLQADIESGWFLYGQDIPEDGPIPTQITLDHLVEPLYFEEKALVTKSGFDEIFEMNITKFAGRATFSEIVSADKDVESLSGTITFMVCDSEKCLPPQTITFTANIK